MKKIFAAVTLTIFLFSATHSIPGQINFQGVLNDAAGSPVTDTLSIAFSIYSAASGGSALWTETQSVSIEAGVYSVQLGSVTPISNIFDGSTRYLGIAVGADSEMTPRLPMISVPYAYRAATAEVAITAESANTVADSSITPAKLNVTAIDSNGKLRALTSDYLASLDGSQLTNLSATLAATATNADTVDNIHASPTPTENYLYPLGVGAKFPNSVLNTGEGNGLDADTVDGFEAANLVQFAQSVSQETSNQYGAWLATSHTSGRAVYGQASGASGPNNGGYFTSASGSGRGVYAESPKYGVYAQASGTSGRAVYGYATAGSGGAYGGEFLTASTDGRGIIAYASAGSGTNYGGYFSANSPSGYGIYGINNNADLGSETGAALWIQGKIKSETGTGRCVGTDTITAGNPSKIVSNTAVSNSSIILLTVGHAASTAGSNTNEGIRISAVTQDTDFTVSTMDGNNASVNIPFSYLIIN